MKKILSTLAVATISAGLTVSAVDAKPRKTSSKMMSGKAGGANSANSMTGKKQPGEFGQRLGKFGWRRREIGKREMKKAIVIAGALLFSTAAFAQSGTPTAPTSPTNSSANSGASGSATTGAPSSNGPGGAANAGAVGGGSAGAGSPSSVGGGAGGVGASGNGASAGSGAAGGGGGK